MKIILASKSPRRKEILKEFGIEFEIQVSEVDESIQDGTLPKDAVMEISHRKAQKVLENCKDDDFIIIAADTVVALCDRIIGKPKDENDAFDILSSLSGSEHYVFTGFTVCNNKKCITGFEQTKVIFRDLSKDEIWDYIKTGEPMDKAGAYGIQEHGDVFVKELQGNYYNVVGLPIEKILVTIKENFGINL